MLIDDVLQHIHNQGLAQLSTNLFRSFLPESPDSCMAVIDTGGTEPDVDIPTKEPTFQVFIRSGTYTEGKTLLDAIRALFHRQSNVQLVPNGTYFYYILAISEGGHLGRDDVGRDTFSINFRCKTR